LFWIIAGVRYGLKIAFRDYREHLFASFVLVSFIVMLGYAAFKTFKFLIEPSNENEPNLPLFWIASVILFLFTVYAHIAAKGIPVIGN
jgi:hypothetical protein